VARSRPGEECEQSLSWILYLTGASGLLALVCALPAITARWGGCQVFDRVASFTNFPALISAVLQVALSITGFFWVLGSSRDKCGALLWEVCNFAYITLPVGILVLGCCGPCCFCCCAGAAEYAEMQGMDRELMEP